MFFSPSEKGKKEQNVLFIFFIFPLLFLSSSLLFYSLCFFHLAKFNKSILGSSLVFDSPLSLFATETAKFTLDTLLHSKLLLLVSLHLHYFRLQYSSFCVRTRVFLKVSMKSTEEETTDTSKSRGIRESKMDEKDVHMKG